MGEPNLFIIKDSGSSRCLLRESATPKINPKALGVLEGICSDFSQKTRNDNFYSGKLWENVLVSDYYKEAMETKTLFGELDHPAERLEVSAQEAAICCTKLWMDNEQQCLMGTFDILPTDKGKIVKALCDYGSVLGVSSRGVGDLEQTEKGNVVQEDSYLFVCFDVVVQPAAVKARQKYESLTESEKVKAKPVMSTILDSIASAKTEEEVESIKLIAERAGVDVTNLTEAIEKRLIFLKEKENSSIIKIQRLNNDLEAAYLKIGHLQKQVDENNVLAEFSFLRGQLTKIKEAVETSQNELVREYANAMRENKSLKTKHDNVCVERKELKQQIKQLQSKHKQIVESLESRLKAQLDENTRLSGTVDYAVAFVEKCKKVYNNLQKINESNAQEIVTLNKASQETVKKASEDRKTLESNIKALTNSVASSQRLLETLRSEYITSKERDYGVDLSMTRREVLEAKSLADIDLVISKNIADRKRGKQTTTPSVMSSLLENQRLNNSVNETGIASEETSVVRQAFDLLHQKKNKN